MASTGKNAIFNLLGSLSGPLIGLVMTPFYLGKIGLDGLGLVGLMTLITTTLNLFIAGASKTYQRDVSTALAGKPEELGGLVKGGLLFFSGIGLLLAAVVFTAGGFEVRSLAASTRFSEESLNNSLILISVLLCVGVINGALTSTLICFRDQVWPNIAGIVVGLLVALAGWLALSRWPRVDVFYACQAGGALVTWLLFSTRCTVAAKRAMAGIPQLGIRRAWNSKLAESGKLSLVLIVHEGLGILISQIDRILVTSQFPLAMLGAYNLGANPARLMNIFTGPVNNVSYPDFCHLAASGADRQATGEYLGRVTFLMLLLFSAGMIVLIPAAEDLLVLWLGAHQVPAAAPACFALLGAGYLLLGVAGPSYNLAVAHGKAGFGIPKNLISLIVLPPAGFLLSKLWGMPGIACIPVIYALICVIVCGAIAFRRHADISAGKPWMFSGLAALALATAFVLPVRLMLPPGPGRLAASIVGAGIFVILFMFRHFGAQPKRWMSALDRRNTFTGPSPMPAASQS